jgi:hypothetical protein
MLSTLRSYVEAMGDRLWLTVEFPDKTPVSLEGLGDTDEPLPRHYAPARRAWERSREIMTKGSRHLFSTPRARATKPDRGLILALLCER